MTYQLHTSIDINAPVDRVWQVFSRFEDYPQWSAFIQRIEGRVEPGSRVRIRLVPPGSRGITIRPKIVRFEAPRELRWVGHMGIPGLFDGEHYFQLEPLADNRTRFIQGEFFGGLLVPLLRKMIDGSTRDGFDSFNQALKEICERSS